MVHKLIVSGSLLLLVFLRFSTSTPISGVGSDTIKTSDGTTIDMPAMARKAGGSWKPELVQTQEEMKGKHDDTSDNEYSYEDEEEEPQCPRKMFYHIRGRRCVPLRCVGGNKKRNPETGECPVSESFNGRSYSNRYYQPVVYRSTRYYTFHRMRGGTVVKKVG